MARGANGKFVADLDTAERDAEACRLRTRGLSFREIAAQLKFTDERHAHNAVRRALSNVIREAAEEYRAAELLRLDQLWQVALGVLERHHVTVSQGRVVYLGDKPLADDGPALQAIDRLLRIQDRRAKLLGLDAPTRVQVVTVDLVDAEIARLSAELAGGGPGPAAGPGAAGQALAIEGPPAAEG